MLNSTVSFDIFTDNNRTSFRIFLCLPTLELTTFQQEVAQQEKYVTQIHYHRGQTAAKKKRDHFEQHRAH